MRYRYVADPSQLVLGNKALDALQSQPSEHLDVGYPVTPREAQDFFDTADVKSFEKLEVSSVNSCSLSPI